MTLPAASIVTVTRGGHFFVRLLVEKVREFVGARDYEIIAVDRGSSDGTARWLGAQPDVRLLTFEQSHTLEHGHGEAAELGARQARHERIVLLDSDAHPLDARWLADSADRLDGHHRLAGAVFRDHHRGNPHGWYVHPHFMAFLKSDLDSLVVLRKVRGDDTDTGEEATLRMIAAGRGIIGHEIEFCAPLAVGDPRVPTTAGGVFHAWYVTRLEQDEASVVRETNGAMTRASYLVPMQAKLRAHYRLSY
ncbi:MAG: glycosyltransferase family 2 protein [Alphaproteobacteria bacterium]